MKTHFANGLFIGALINLACQLAGAPSLSQARLDLAELSCCAFIAGLASLATRLLVLSVCLQLHGKTKNRPLAHLHEN